ncbi:TPA-induced transmembrane protein homolog isoform X2 [Hippocampus comes]|uniref:SEA domain-containing protein n=2 Tax=Hippocampus comes TaxID=109280 RepID=A0A3Q2YUN3_HIPCM|nr:PREDICTED: TPA-induced transmembrane protein isoform X2 [Hippocampus comes]XP_019742931.1 PREDICTED: TPA-induced transmembrane protein isoform X2 [Hippocampus comes]
MTTDFEMQAFKTNGSDAVGRSLTTGNGANHAYRCRDEGSVLLSAQRNGHSGETMPSGCVTAEAFAGSKESAAHKVKRELSEAVCGKVRLWMLLVLLPVVIVAVVLISLGVCSAIHEDTDEKFNRSSFRVARLFNGSFSLPGLTFTEDLLSLSSNQSRALTGDLQGKLSDVYRSSPALGRYFSKAEIYALRPGSVIAEYQLTFVMPEEHQEQLRSFTLSREMVYNVLRQFLYDQEGRGASPSSALYIDPVSLKLS